MRHRFGLESLRHRRLRARRALARATGPLRERRLRVFGVTVVRDEEDLVGAVIRYHLAAGCDVVLVADDGSTDGTRAILDGLAQATGRVRWRPAHEGRGQAGELSGLAREAAALGAHWIVPFDADELWHAPDGLRHVLARTPAPALRCRIVTFVQEHDVLEPGPGTVRRACWRAPTVIGSPRDAPELVRTGGAAYVETDYPPKWLSRATSDLSFAAGSHDVSTAAGGLDTADVRCLHLPLRARSVLQAKAAVGRQLDAPGLDESVSWHSRRWGRLDADRLDEEWEANSARDGALRRLDGTVVRLVRDARFTTLLEPHLDG